MTIRQDTIASTTSADGDFQNLKTNSIGALYTSLSHLGANAVSTGNGVAGTGVQRVCIASDNTTFAVTATLAAGTNTNEVVGDVAHDGVAAGNPVLIGARASAAVPTDVSADNDVTQLWALRSGALAIQSTFAGVLSVAGNGASGTGVQRVTIANDSTGILAAVTNVATIGTSVTPGTSAAHLGKAEDAPHVSGDTGVAVWAVRTRHSRHGHQRDRRLRSVPHRLGRRALGARCGAARG
jgi:hypothetical protein